MNTTRRAVLAAVLLVSAADFASAKGRRNKLRLGDMIFEPGQFEVLDGPDRRAPLRASGAEAVPASYVRSGTKKWPDGRLPLEFSGDVSRSERELVLAACREWSSRANVRCVVAPRENVRIKVIKGEGCYSEVGYGSEGFPGNILPGRRKDVRELSLGQGCWGKSTIIHELGHALGLTHEHQRPDRDRYIQVLWDNIEKDKEGNFRRLSGGWTFGIPYDFESIMHYSRGTFGRGSLHSWEPRRGYEEESRLAGSASVPSHFDGLTVSKIYGAPRVASRP